MYRNASLLGLTAVAGVMGTNLRNWSTDATAPFTVVVIQSLDTPNIDWGGNFLAAELSCAAAPATTSLTLGTREAYIVGATPGATAFHTSKPVPVEPGWTLHAFVRRRGGTGGAYYYGGAISASGGIALRESFANQPPISIGPDRLTVGTSTCMSTAKGRTQLGVVLVYSRALNVTDLKRIHEAYAPRFGWVRGARTVECGRWTKGGPGETRVQQDCDGDGLLDSVLVDVTGARGVALSSRGCSTEDADTGYPNAPASACPAVLGGFCAKPPGEWCLGGEILQLDCDGDGVRDLACVRNDERSNLTVIRSRLGCSLLAADSSCPPLTARGSCAFPAGSLCSQGRMLSVDCDADGVRDWSMPAAVRDCRPPPASAANSAAATAALASAHTHSSPDAASAGLVVRLHPHGGPACASQPGHRSP
ncbi:hypothetical protein HYH03_005946 [Edaphochlamys debaryana]|uniref:Uncharacterized protein n=1 Tax=Edaphochlamys debaryana TaxID=47281 RepID=A0A835YEA5_9CHLO|nr:hypothetical protein HYH03_005946 [Edaphochlamys debaryana]|eukprot:KAG2496024.1 hypothetical protein HYH03_005946 [Edaphochlamys debaryana]